MKATHPDHAAEQAYIERVYQADEAARARAERMPELAPDKHAARSARERLLERFQDPIDLEALCFGRIDLEGDQRLYLGRGAVHDENGQLLVVNWRVDKAAPFYTASPRDRCGLEGRRRFQLDRLRLLGIVDERFV